MSADALDQLLQRILAYDASEPSESWIDDLKALKADPRAELALGTEFSVAVHACDLAADVHDEFVKTIRAINASLRVDPPNRITGLVEMTAEIPVLPIDDWTNQLADAVHNIRRSFDNMAFRLGCRRFPVCTLIHGTSGEAKTAWLAKNGAGNPHKECGSMIVDGLPSRLVEVVKSVQPFLTPIDGRPELSPLEVIRRLDNYFKHDSPRVVEIVPVELAPMPPHPRIFRAQVHKVPLRPGKNVIASCTDRYPDAPLDDAPWPGIGFEARLTDGAIRVDALRYVPLMSMMFATIIAVLSSVAVEEGLLA